MRRVTGVKSSKDQTNIVAAILLTSALVGPNEKKIAEYIKLEPKVVREYGRIAREQGIWEKGKINAEWADKQYGSVALICDALCVLGLLSRSTEKPLTAAK